MRYVHRDGSAEELNGDKTYVQDHIVQRFEVVIRSLSGVGEDTLKDLIQKKYEVVSLKKVDETTYVR